MGISFSQLLLGAHTAMELIAGSALFLTGVASVDPVEGKKRSPTDKLYKRWHAAGLLSLGYVGLLGLGVVGDGQDNTKKNAIDSCAIFQGLAGLAQLLAFRDGQNTLMDATLLNMHMWMAIGFGSLKMRQ